MTHNAFICIREPWAAYSFYFMNPAKIVVSLAMLYSVQE